VLSAVIMSGALLATACEGPFDVAPGRIGALRIGPVELITGGNWPYRRSFSEDDGGGHYSYVVTLCPGVQIEAEADINASEIYELSTQSSAFVTAEGAYVGMTVAELKTTYPRGELHYADVEGRYAGFETGRGITFTIDYSGIADKCFETGSGCDHLFLSKRSLSLFTH
jgi:hypothetical protein